MKTINKVILLGNLVRDATLNHTHDGSAVCNASVATNNRKTDKPQFTDIVLWNKAAELFVQLTEKGSCVYIEGMINTLTWEDENYPGLKRNKSEVIVGDFVVLDRKQIETITEDVINLVEGEVFNDYDKRN